MGWRKALAKFNEAEGARIIAWYQDAMGLQDWTVDLYVQDEPPDWCTEESRDPDCVGVCGPDALEKTTSIWVCPARHEGRRREPGETLMHELFHAQMADVGMKDDCETPFHFVINRVGRVLYLAYLAGKGKRT